MGTLEFRQAEKIRDTFAQHGVRCLFTGRSGAVLLGFADTAQDAELIIERTPENGVALVAALRGLGFSLSTLEAVEMLRSTNPVCLNGGPFELKVAVAPEGIDGFGDAWSRHVDIAGFPVCHLDDIIANMAAGDGASGRASLPRLRAFRESWIRKP